MQFKSHIFHPSYFAARVSNLVLGFLVFELEYASARVNALACCTLLELLHGNGPNVLQVVGTWIRNDAVPDDGRVGVIVGAWPVCCDVYENLLRIPGEKRREVGFKRETNDGILLLLGAIVVRAAFDTAAHMSVNRRTTQRIEGRLLAEAEVVHTLEVGLS